MAPIATETSSTYAGHLSNGDSTLASKGYKPTHPGSFEVIFEGGNYNSKLVARKNFKKNDVIASLAHATPCNTIRYSTVQVGENSHIELNSDLLYMNHSCSPTARVDVSSASPSEWCVRAEEDIEEGGVMSFFYPSTEWNMAQPFDCSCKTSRCLKLINGASHIAPSTLATYFVNAHILRLKIAQLRATDEVAAEIEITRLEKSGEEVLARGR